MEQVLNRQREVTQFSNYVEPPTRTENHVNRRRLSAGTQNLGRSEIRRPNREMPEVRRAAKGSRGRNISTWQETHVGRGCELGGTGGEYPPWFERIGSRQRDGSVVESEFWRNANVRRVRESGHVAGDSDDAGEIKIGCGFQIERRPGGSLDCGIGLRVSDRLLSDWFDWVVAAP